jgi:hypothetical protein
MSKTFKIASREVRSGIADGKIEFTVVCRLAAKDTQMFENLSDRDSSSARAARLIEEKSQTLANALCTKFSPELLGADCLLKRFYPQIYRRYSENLDALYERVSFKIVIKE